MKPYQNPNHSRLEARPAASSGPPPVVLRRYVHPIRTTPVRPPVQDQLDRMLVLMERQSGQIEEVLRCLKRDNSDTQ